MGIKSVDAGMLKAAVLASAKRLESKKEWINELNVFRFRMEIREPI